MSRIARAVAMEFPHHVVQRGNNRQPIFINFEDYEKYFYLLKKYAEKSFSSILAYCLMPNHVHLLIKPKKENSLNKMMQGIALSYTQYINRKYERTGRLWESRYFSSIVGSERYLWTVVAYIELNPVRAHMVQKAEEYAYSSARAHLLGTEDPLLNENVFDRSERIDYKIFIKEGLNLEQEKKLESATMAGRPFGSERFIKKMERKLGKTLFPQPWGRPRDVIKM